MVRGSRNRTGGLAGGWGESRGQLAGPSLRRSDSFARVVLQDNVTAAVDEFAQKHKLGVGDATSVLASVIKQGTEARVLPALEFPVFLDPGVPGQEAEEETFQLHQVRPLFPLAGPSAARSHGPPGAWHPFPRVFVFICRPWPPFRRPCT